MGTKTKLAIAAGLLLGAAAAWRTLTVRDDVVHEPPAGDVISAPAEAAATTSAIEAERVASDAPTVSQRPGLGLGTEVDPGSLLRVRVLDVDAQPCTTGRLACFWSESFSYGHGDRAHVLELDLAGEVTEVALPKSAQSAELYASVAREPASPRVIVERLGMGPQGQPLGRRDVREVTIELAKRIEGRRLAGGIRVDGEPRIPRGLRIRMEGPWEQARIHALERRYEVGRDDTSEKLFVVSEETVPLQLDVAGDATQLDLDLSTGRTLKLTVVDRRTERPLPGRELFVAVAAVVERESIFRELWREGWQFPRTDASGVAIVRGLPQKGRVTVRRDARTREKHRLMEGGITRISESMREPLLEQALDRKSPAVIERTLRLDAEELGLVLRGELSRELREVAAADDPAMPGLGSIEVKWARIGEDGEADVHDEILPLADGARFELAIEPEREYRVWVERERMRLSDVVAVQVADVAPAPIVLAARRGTEIRLRVVRCPTSGFVSIYVADPGAVRPQGFVVPAAGGEIERRFLVDGPTWVDVGWEQERGFESGKSQRVRVDPATSALVEVDLAADAARPVVLELSCGEPLPHSQLWLERLDAPPGTPVTTINVFLEGAKSHGPAVIDPGRYLALLHGMPGVVAAVIEIEAGPADRPIVIPFELEGHAREGLGAGFEVTRLGSLELDHSWRGVCRVRFADRPDLDGVSTILIPADAAFTLLAE